MPRPPHIEPFFFTFPDDDDLAEIIDLVRPLKLSQFVPTLIRATNDLYLLSAVETNTEYATNGGVTALSDAYRVTLQRKYGLGSWTVTGALYGASRAALQPQLDRLAKHFLTSGKGRQISREEAENSEPLHILLHSSHGTPSDLELKMLSWRPGGGAIWLPTGSPMLGSVVKNSDLAVGASPPQFRGAFGSVCGLPRLTSP